MGSARLSVIGVCQCELELEGSDDVGRQGSYESSIEFRYFVSWDVSDRDRGVEQVAGGIGVEGIYPARQDQSTYYPIIPPVTSQPPSSERPYLPTALAGLSPAF